MGQYDKHGYQSQVKMIPVKYGQPYTSCDWRNATNTAVPPLINPADRAMESRGEVIAIWRGSSRRGVSLGGKRSGNKIPYSPIFHTVN